MTYTYNPNGTVATKTDAKNQVMGYTYDTYKRVTKITCAGNACQTVDYWYDANPHDGSWSVNTWGRVAAIQYGGQNCQGGLFQEFYKYTAAGLPAAKKLRFWRNNSWYELASAHGYDNEGRNTSVTYPGYYVWDTEDEEDDWKDGPTYKYTFDPMGRPVKLTQGIVNPIDWAKDVTYNAAGQITQIKYGQGAPYVETRTYNTRQQMTRLTVAGMVDWEYRYSATQNNGQITQMRDWVTGEEVTYQYDSLKRLISAVTTGPEWGLSFSYDGFGNKTGQNVTKGSAPVMNLSFNELTNWINPQHGFSYDANGNVTGMPSMTNTYDAANRLTQVVHNLTGTQQYAYAPDNKRVWHMNAQGKEFFQYYDVSGKRLGSYYINVYDHITISYVGALPATNVYFGSKMILSEGRQVFLDRLGSVRLQVVGSFERVNYFPYGEGMTSAARNFATYERNPSTGVDYADQRYYSNIHGRFLSPDPYVASAGVGDPGSWNRYAYVQGDPINFNDPLGLCRESATSTSITVCSGPIEPLQDELMRYYYSGAYDHSSPYAPHLSLPPGHEFGRPPGPLPPIESETDCDPANMPRIQFDRNRPMQPQVESAMRGLGVMRFIDESSIRVDGGGITFAIERGQGNALYNYVNTNDCFASGRMYGFHTRQVPNARGDFRSYRLRGSTGSLQVVLGPDSGYADLDRFSFYQDLSDAFGHTFGEVLPHVFRNWFGRGTSVGGGR